MAVQHRQRVGQVVQVPIVKGDAKRARRQLPFAKRAYGCVERQNLKPSFQPAADFVKTLAIRLVGEERVGSGMHAVEDGDRELATRARRGKSRERTAHQEVKHGRSFGVWGEWTQRA